MNKGGEQGNPAQDNHLLNKPLVYAAGLRSISYFPSWFSCWLAEKIADASYFFYKNARENVKSNLRNVFPDISDKKLSSIALHTFRNYGTYLVDYGRFNRFDNNSLRKVLSQIDGEENIKRVLDKGKGILLLTAHLGNWELGGIFFGKNNVKINVVTYKDEIPAIESIKTRYRMLHNINTIVLGDSPFSSLDVMAALNRNEVVAMLVDRYGKQGGIEVDFFGKRTYFPAGPVMLSKMSGAPIIPAFVVKEGRDAYRGIVEEPIEIPSDRNIETGSYIKQIVEIFEKYITRYPDQWYNFVPIGDQNAA